MHLAWRAGLGLQVLQQLAGINTVMYYTPAILELAGFHDKRSALLIAMAPAAGAIAKSRAQGLEGSGGFEQGRGLESPEPLGL